MLTKVAGENVGCTTIMYAKIRPHVLTNTASLVAVPMREEEFRIISSPSTMKTWIVMKKFSAYESKGCPLKKLYATILLYAIIFLKDRQSVGFVLFISEACMATVGLLLRIGVMPF